MKSVFAKLHCEQSDFLIANAALPENAAAFCSQICNRRTGAGSDGVVFVQKKGIDYTAQQVNPDGSFANLCDAALRCTAKYLSLKNEKVNCFTINNSKAKILSTSLIETSISNISFEPHNILPLRLKSPVIDGLCEICGEGVRLTAVQCGLPYAAVFCDNAENIDISTKGGLFQNSRTFLNGINVVFIQIVDKNCIRLKVFRSGCGEVPSCSNAAASAVYVASYLHFSADDVNAVFNKGAMKIKLNNNSASILATAHFVGSFDFKE